MDKHFYPQLGAKAFPDGCPCCGEVLEKYQPADDTWEEHWEFACGCTMIANGDSKLPYCDEDCPDAMEQHLEGFIVHDGRAALASTRKAP